jgi:hypothetical protein
MSSGDKKDQVLTAYKVSHVLCSLAELMLKAVQDLTDIPAQQQTLPGRDVDMEPYAEFTKLENWDQDGKPYLAEVSICLVRSDASIFLTHR